MKKKLLAILLMVMLVLTACGGKEETPASDNPVAETPVAEEQEKEETGKKTEALAGIYPEADELVEVPMGTYGADTMKDYCTVMIPANYFGGAVADLSAAEQYGFDMMDGDDLLTDAIANGLLEEENRISSITITNTNLTGDNTTIHYLLYYKDMLEYEGFKNAYPECKEIGTIEHPAVYNADESDYPMGDMIFCYAVNPDITLVIYYEGPLYDEIGLDAIAESLYDTISAI